MLSFAQVMLRILCLTPITNVGEKREQKGRSSGPENNNQKKATVY